MSFRYSPDVAIVAIPSLGLWHERAPWLAGGVELRAADGAVGLTREPAVAVSGRLRVRKTRERELRVARLLFDADSVAKGDLVHAVAAPLRAHLMLTSADCEDDGEALSGGDDHVPRLGRTMHEVPLPQQPFLALDDQERLTREDEEILLIQPASGTSQSARRGRERTG
jgi:hypothetical protein